MAALVAIVLGISGSLMLNRETSKADSTTVVKVANLTAPVGGGWFYYNDTTDAYDNTPGVLGTFVSGPAGQPLGAGSAQITIPTLNDRTNLSTFQFAGTLLSNVSELQFDAVNVSASAPAFLFINADFDGSNVWQKRLVHVPSSVTVGSWATYDAYQSGNALWTYSGTTWPSSATPASTPKTWNTILSEYSGIKVLASDPQVGVRVGHGVAGPGQTVNLDKFVIKISGDQKTFDFEPTVACTTDCYVNDATGNDLNGGSLAEPLKTIQAAVTAVNAGGTVHVASGTYTIPSTITVNKAVTIVGTGTPVVQVSGTGPRLHFTSPGSTLQGFKFVKTDKVGEQNIVQIAASNTTITGNEFQGQYVFGDPDVSRAMVINAGAMTGLSITNNVIHDLRQPGYMSGTNTGVISGNYTYRTRGWVIEGGDLTFTNNTWGAGANQNIFDIAILAAVGPTYYTDVPAMSAINNNAFIEDQRTLPPTLSIVYVSPTGSSGNTGTAISPKQTIQQGVDRAVIGGTVHVLAGTYNEDVSVTKAGVKLLGAGIGNTIVSGPSGGGGSTFQISAAGVLMDGFSITRDGNAVGTWNGPLNTAGVAVQSQGNTVELRNSHLYGLRTGVDVNNSNGNNIHNNIIDNNRTGLIFRNQTDNTQLKNNFITNNWTVGVLFLDASSGSNVPVQQALTSNFNENNISGNWYGQIVDRQSGGVLPTPGTNLKHFENNWYGTAAPVVSILDSAEPGYAAQIPVVYGGGAVPPGGQPDILGPASANFDYQPLLCSGVDASPVVGFQPVFGCGDVAIVAPATANVGDTGISVQVVANNAVNLYGVQMTVTYDPQLVLTGYTFGPTLGPGYPLAPPALVTNVPGSLSFAFTQVAPNPAATGSGLVLATLTFGAVAPGTANIAVSPGAVFANDQGFQIGPNSTVNDSIVVSGAATNASGTILLQGRTNHSGATAEINPPVHIPPAPAIPGSPLATTDAFGNFTIAGVPTGSQTIRARMLGYLLASKVISFVSGPNSAGTVTLIGGDADMSGVINILDLSLVAAYFGQSPAYAPPLAVNTTPDINGDNIVNILDLSLTAANFGDSGPDLWP